MGGIGINESIGAMVNEIVEIAVDMIDGGKKPYQIMLGRTSIAWSSALTFKPSAKVLER